MLNVLNLTIDAVMLGTNVPTYMEAVYWLDYYRKNYGVGVPYPNGKGYCNGQFVIVRWDEVTEAYYCIH